MTASPTTMDLSLGNIFWGNVTEVQIRHRVCVISGKAVFLSNPGGTCLVDLIALPLARRPSGAC